MLLRRAQRILWKVGSSTYLINSGGRRSGPGALPLESRWSAARISIRVIGMGSGPVGWSVMNGSGGTGGGAELKKVE